MLQVNLFTITSSNSTCNQQLNYSGIGTKENKYDFKLYYTLTGYKDKHIRRLSLITTLIWFFTAKYVDPLFYGHNIYPNV